MLFSPGPSFLTPFLHIITDEAVRSFFWGGSPSSSVLSHYTSLLQKNMRFWSPLLCSACGLYFGNSILVLSLWRVRLEARCYQSWLTVGIQLLSAIDMCHLLPNLNYVPMDCMDWRWQCTTGFHSIDRKDGLLSIGFQCRLFIISISAQVNMNIMKIY